MPTRPGSLSPPEGEGAFDRAVSRSYARHFDAPTGPPWGDTRCHVGVLHVRGQDGLPDITPSRPPVCVPVRIGPVAPIRSTRRVVTIMGDR